MNEPPKPLGRRKSPDAFRTIGEAAAEIGVEPHVLRFWETKFTRLKPLTRAGGRRYYRPEDLELLRRIKQLLHDDGLTIRGAQKILQGRQSGDLLEALSGQPDNALAAAMPTTAGPALNDIRQSLEAIAADARRIANGGEIPRI